jgi:predicted anti-sigma-YlaC factor YlaD
MMAEFQCGDVMLLSDLLDDRLPSDREAELTAHLEVCEVCRGVFDELAAESRWWSDLRRYVRPDPQTGEFPSPSEAATDPDARA